MRPITFAVAVNGREILQKNLLASPVLAGSHSHEILIQEGFSSASKAYNDAINNSQNDLVAFVHQDMILPQGWLTQLDRALAYLETDDPNWGVIGTYGETLDDGGRGHIYSSGRGIIGKPFEHPAEVQTLDEIVLILRRSSGLRFDDTLPHFHFYGVDICMRAEEAGRKNYAISAFCIHNTKQTLVLPPEFYECYGHIKKRWKKHLPIQTTCIRMTESDAPLYTRRLQEAYLRYIRRKEIGGSRMQDVSRLIDEVNARLEGEESAASTL